MNSEEVTIISIAGKQNAGKTTLIRTLIPELKEEDKYMVENMSIIVDDPYGFESDDE